MLASLEVRAPWLDYRLIEFAFSRVPDHLRATRRQRKILPRRLAERCLPHDLDLRRKQGFSLPLGRWFRGGWGDYIRQVLGSDSCLFDRKAVEGLLAGQRRGRSNTQRLFALAMLELWRREYRVAV
jgi:asparagine synthase (glutamine-hydrolysing)